LKLSAAALSALVPTAPRERITRSSRHAFAKSFEAYWAPLSLWKTAPARSPPRVGGGFEGVGDQLGAQVIGDRPARQALRAKVQHRGQVKELAIADGQVGDVADVLGVRFARGEVALQEVGDLGPRPGRAPWW